MSYELLVMSDELLVISDEWAGASHSALITLHS